MHDYLFLFLCVINGLRLKWATMSLIIYCQSWEEYFRRVSVVL